MGLLGRPGIYIDQEREGAQTLHWSAISKIYPFLFLVIWGLATWGLFRYNLVTNLRLHGDYLVATWGLLGYLETPWRLFFGDYLENTFVQL